VASLASPRPSASARHVALVRARLERTHTPDGDLRGEELLHASLAADDTPFARFLAARTEFFDTELLDALRAGISQVVILGAGYDGRSLRFKSPGVRFVEVDLPATQADKMRRLHTLDISTGHIDFAAADLTAERVPDVLSDTAYNPLIPAVFVCEGVLLYLPRDAVTRVLTGIRSGATAGSVLLVSFAIGGPRPRSEPLWRKTSGERRQSFYTPAEAASLLRRCGWIPARTGNPDPARTQDADIALFVRALASA